MFGNRAKSSEPIEASLGSNNSSETDVNNPSQEDLLGFVLGALDADQQQQVQQLIDQDPDLEEQLLDLKSALAPLELIDTVSGERSTMAGKMNVHSAGESTTFTGMLRATAA